MQGDYQAEKELKDFLHPKGNAAELPKGLEDAGPCAGNSGLRMDAVCHRDDPYAILGRTV
ncbi:MAG: hypothetical protein AUG12_02035 [Acidobacteria bacterium 13_1_20CM_2_57_8]|nr:MAG: hypothetical protein AUG12_02035 [Acidobacteria bacterium 13_1_20CM_2_57_8]